MMVVLLIAGAGVLLAGLLTVAFGIQMDLSFGNTLILSGTVAAGTGMIMLSLWAVAQELKRIATRLGPDVSTRMHAETGAAQGIPGDQALEDGGFLFSLDQLGSEDADHGEPAAPSSAPWREEAAGRNRGASAPAEPAEAEPAAKSRRNLLFSSSSRKERERAQGRATDPSAADPGSAPPPESSELQPPSFEESWPRPERSRAGDPPAQRRGGRTPSTFTDAKAGAAAVDRYPQAGRNEDQPPVTVLKSGVVDGMAYSLYSDGSIEAQLPEGMMRFASIDELRAHLDQRS
jgi:hypothetical protein